MQELVRCGLLRQLHSTLGRNVAPTYQVRPAAYQCVPHRCCFAVRLFTVAAIPLAYADRLLTKSVCIPRLLQVVLRKMLRAVEALPLSADDVHLTRSAHGTFGDILQLLSYHSDPEVPPAARFLPVPEGCMRATMLFMLRYVAFLLSLLLVRFAHNMSVWHGRCAQRRWGCFGSTRCRRARGQWCAAVVASPAPAPQPLVRFSGCSMLHSFQSACCTPPELSFP